LKSSVVEVVQFRDSYPSVGKPYFIVDNPIIDTRTRPGAGYGSALKYAKKENIRFIGEYTGMRGGDYKFINNGVEVSIPFDHKKSAFFVNLPAFEQGLEILEQDWDYNNIVDLKAFLGPESAFNSHIGKEQNIVEVSRNIEVGKKYFHSRASIVDNAGGDWRNYKYYASEDKLEYVGEFIGHEYFDRDSGGYNFLKDGVKKFIFGCNDGTDGFIEYIPSKQ
jgi:hypothetical protein